MRTLFTTLEEIKDFVTIDISGNFDTIKPYLLEAHKYVLKGLDKATFESLLDYVESETEQDEDLDNLLEYARRILANFSYAISAKRLGIYVGENGILQFSNQNLEPLSAERLEQVKSEFYNSGFNALELLIIFIQDNPDIYPDTYSYLFENSFFVRTANELNSLIYTDVPNRDFFEMKPKIFLIEQEIEGILGTESFTGLKTTAEDELSDNQKKMLSIIRPAESCLAYASKFKSPEHELKGIQLLESLRIFYASITSAEVDRYSNEDQKIFVFGG